MRRKFKKNQLINSRKYYLAKLARMAFDALTSEMQEGKGCKNDKLIYRAFRKGQDFFEIVIK